MPDDSPTGNEYWDEVFGIAQDAVREYPDDEDAQMEYVHQTVDGHRWIIYNAYNEDVLRYTDNDPDPREVHAMAGEDADWERERTIAAFMAMENDVLQELSDAREKMEEEKDEKTEEAERLGRKFAEETWRQVGPGTEDLVPDEPQQGDWDSFQKQIGEPWSQIDDIRDAFETAFTEVIEEKKEQAGA